MGVTIEGDPPLTFDAELLADIISAATIGDIIERVSKGLGADDEKMKPYSKSYLAKLKREGRSPNVDLHYSGLMLSQVREVSRTVVKRDQHGTATHVRLTFGVGNAGNRAAIAAYNHDRRPWFYLSPKGEDRVQEAVGDGVRVSRHTSAKTKGIVRRRGAGGRFLKGSDP